VEVIVSKKNGAIRLMPTTEQMLFAYPWREQQ
jgi:hypothetical protein